MLTNKILAIIGSIFIFISMLVNLLSQYSTSFIFLITLDAFFIVGVILLIIAIKSIATIIKDETIFKNYLKFGIPWIAALFILTIYPLFSTPSQIDLSYYSLTILIAVIAASLMVYSAEYLYKCFKSISQYYNIVLFTIVGYFYLVSTILILVLFIIPAALIGISAIGEIDLAPFSFLLIIANIFLLVGSILQLVAFMIIPKKS